MFTNRTKIWEALRVPPATKTVARVRQIMLDQVRKDMAREALPDGLDIRDLLTPEQLRHFVELRATRPIDEALMLCGALSVAAQGLQPNATDKVRTAWRKYAALKVAKETGFFGPALVHEIALRYTKGDPEWRRLLTDKAAKPDSIRKWANELSVDAVDTVGDLLRDIAETVLDEIKDQQVYDTVTLEDVASAISVKLEDAIEDLDPLDEIEGTFESKLIQLANALPDIDDSTVYYSLRQIGFGKRLSGD